MTETVATDAASLQKRLDRAAARITILEGMIEDKTRTLYLAQEELRAKNDFMAGVLNSMQSAVLVTDGDAMVTDIHGATVAMTGRAAADLVGHALFDLVSLRDNHPADLSSLDGTVVDAELRCDGGAVPVLLTTSLIVDEADGRSYVVLATDISQQRRLEVELRHAQKLESVGQLAAGVAHEINTPIQFVGDSINFIAEAIDDSLELIRAFRSFREAASAAGVLADQVTATTELEEELDIEFVEDEAPRSVQRTREGVRRVAEIVAAMKQFSHPGDGGLGATDLNAIIENTLIVAKNEYKYVAEVHTDLGPIPEVLANPGDIGQVILNLVVNSAHAIADHLGDSGELGRITVATTADENGVSLVVSDTGGGVPAEIRDRIFDPFFTTKEPGKGTGQGLAIARTIVVDRHNGRLDLSVDPGVGSTFTVWLPSA